MQCARAVPLVALLLAGWATLFMATRSTLASTPRLSISQFCADVARTTGAPPERFHFSTYAQHLGWRDTHILRPGEGVRFILLYDAPCANHPKARLRLYRAGRVDQAIDPVGKPLATWIMQARYQPHGRTRFSLSTHLPRGIRGHVFASIEVDTGFPSPQKQVGVWVNVPLTIAARG